MKFLNDYSDNVYEHFSYTKLTKAALKKYDLGSSRKTARRGSAASAASTGSSMSNSSSGSTLRRATGGEKSFDANRYLPSYYQKPENIRAREIKAENAEFEELDKIERAKMKPKVDKAEAAKAFKNELMKGKNIKSAEANKMIGKLNKKLNSLKTKLNNNEELLDLIIKKKRLSNEGIEGIAYNNTYKKMRILRKKINDEIDATLENNTKISTSKAGIKYINSYFSNDKYLQNYSDYITKMIARNRTERFTESFSNITTKRTIFTKMELKDSIGFIARFLIFKTLEKLNNVENFTQSTPTSSPSEDVDTEFNELIDFETKLIDIVGNFVLNSDFSSPKAKEFEDKIYNNLMNLSDENYNIVLDNHSVPRNSYDLTPQQMIIMLDISNREDKDKFLNDLINTKKLYDSMSDQEKINFENLTADEQERKILALNDARNKKIDQEENKEENKEANETNKDNFKKLYLPLIIVFSVILLLVFIYLLI